MIIEIDDDFSDTIVQQSLLQSYVSLMKDIKTHNKTGQHLDPEDFEMYQKVAAAIEVLGGWYFTNFKEAVKKERKKK